MYPEIVDSPSLCWDAIPGGITFGATFVNQSCKPEPCHEAGHFWLRACSSNSWWRLWCWAQLNTETLTKMMSTLDDCCLYLAVWDASSNYLVNSSKDHQHIITLDTTCEEFQTPGTDLVESGTLKPSHEGTVEDHNIGPSFFTISRQKYNLVTTCRKHSNLPGFDQPVICVLTPIAPSDLCFDSAINT